MQDMIIGIALIWIFQSDCKLLNLTFASKLFAVVASNCDRDMEWGRDGWEAQDFYNQGFFLGWGLAGTEFGHLFPTAVPSHSYVNIKIRESSGSFFSNNKSTL